MARTKQTAQGKSVTRPTQLTQDKMATKRPATELEDAEKAQTTSTTCTATEATVSPTKRARKDPKPKERAATSTDVPVEKKKKKQRKCVTSTVRFHREYEKTFGLAGTIHQLMYGQMSKQKPPMHEEIAEAEMATATEDQHQIEIADEGGVRRITPIKVKEEPSTQYAVIDLTDKEGLPDVPAEAFNLAP